MPVARAADMNPEPPPETTGDDGVDAVLALIGSDEALSVMTNALGWAWLHRLFDEIPTEGTADCTASEVEMLDRMARHLQAQLAGWIEQAAG